MTLRLVGKDYDETPPLPAAGGGGTSGGMDDLIRRVTVLETDCKEIKSSLGRIEIVVARIETRLADLPGAKEFGELKGKVSNLPNTVQVAALVFTIFGLAFVLIRYGLPHLQ